MISIVYIDDKTGECDKYPIPVNIYDYDPIELELRKYFMLEHLAETITQLRRATLKSNMDAGYRHIATLARKQRKAIKVHIEKIDALLKSRGK